jgi:hypothetical protein
MRSPFYVFASYRSVSEWHAHGLTVLQPVAKLRVNTTGKETMSLYFYANLRFAPRLR